MSPRFDLAKEVVVPNSAPDNKPPQLGSLLDEPARAPAPPAPARRSLKIDLTPSQRGLARRLGAISALALLLVGGMWGIFALVPRSEPDYLSDDMQGILDYTLLGEDFNNLPIERRMELLKELVQRLKTLSGEDSTAMAAFAATVNKQMRRQMERNIKRLAVDTIDIYASGYATMPPEKQSEFLDDAVIGFTRMMEDIAGENSPLPAGDAERLAVVKEQAKKDEQRFREDNTRPTARRVAQFFEFIHNDQENVSNPIQRGRNAKFMRDMTRHLRGQDIATGKPVQGPG
jgi:hypothetical protein